MSGAPIPVTPLWRRLFSGEELTTAELEPLLDLAFSAPRLAPRHASNHWIAGLEEVELLKVAHHGSGHSSSSAFLQRVSPEIAVVSCGLDNRYGHPDPETLQRLQSAGAMVFRTDQSGHVRAVSTGTELDVLEGTIEMFRSLPAPEQASVPSDIPLLKLPEESPSDAPATAASPVDSASLSGVRQSTFVDDEPIGKRKKRNRRGSP